MSRAQMKSVAAPMTRARRFHSAKIVSTDSPTDRKRSVPWIGWKD